MSDKSSIKYIISLSIPIFFANLAIPLVGIVDTALMGNSGNKSFLAATSVATSFFSLIFWSFGFFEVFEVEMVPSPIQEGGFGIPSHYMIVYCTQLTKTIL